MSVDSIAFHITDRCQLDCHHCLRDPEAKPADLPIELIEKTLDQVKRVYGTTRVALTGGEPTLYPELPRLLDALADREMAWHMVTNGKRFTRLLELIDENPRRGAYLAAINLSLDGADEQIHDRMRAPGSFREVMSAVTLCASRQIPIVLQMTICAINVHQIESMALLASHLGAQMVSFAMAQPTGTDRDREMFLPVHEWNRVRDQVERLRSALTIRVNMPEGYPVDLPFHTCEPMRSGQLHVDTRGQLNICCQHSGIPSQGTVSDIAGNLADISLPAAHRKMLTIIHDTQMARLEALEQNTLDEWEKIPCNFCLKRFGKPHWSADGASGPQANRERWPVVPLNLTRSANRSAK